MGGGDRLRIRYLVDQPGSVPVVAGWLHDEWGRLRGYSRPDVESEVRSRLNRRRPPLALVALAGPEPVGTVSLIWDGTTEDPGPECFLSGLYVPPDWRRRGVGTRLCRRAARAAARAGVGRLRLLTSGAESYYARLGWRRLGTTAHALAPGAEPVSVMELRLPRA